MIAYLFVCLCMCWHDCVLLQAVGVGGVGDDGVEGVEHLLHPSVAPEAYTILYYNILYYTMLYYTIPYYTIL